MDTTPKTSPTTPPSWLDMQPRQFDTSAKDQPLTLFGVPDAAGTPDLFDLLDEP